MNVGLLVWLGFVAAGVVFLFLLMVGALDSVVPDAPWTDLAKEIINALYTVMHVHLPTPEAMAPTRAPPLAAAGAQRRH